VFFLKLGDRAALAAEVGVLAAVASRGIPAPIVEAVDLDASQTGLPAILTRDVGGEPLAGTEPVFRLAGAHLRAVHEITLDGFGALDATDGELRGEDPTWSEVVSRRVAPLSAIADAGLVPPSVLDRAAAAVNNHQHLVAAVGRGRLLHGDFHPRHVYAADGRITGIIDWGDATSGDPVYDFARIAHAGVVATDVAGALGLVATVLETYGDAPWIPSDLTPKLLLYAAVFIMWSMAGEFDAGAPWPPWWPVQTATLVTILDELGAV
jgi:aminoglycoside phosphotransferase (APT) family kinase protein